MTSRDAVLSHLQPDDRAFLAQLADLARPARVALVGGAVRDALLGRTPLDFDVVVQGANVERLAEATTLKFVYHPRYDNATLTLPDGRHLDLIHARREAYEHPGAAPDPSPGTLHEDLARRDFTINAMAFELGRDSLLDPFGGADDLHRKLLRPLHDASFRDDASRLVRGARLAARLNLDLAPEGYAQVPDAVRFASETPRVKLELPLVFEEDRPGLVLSALRRWEATSLLGQDATDAFLELDASSVATPIEYAAAWLAHQPIGAASAWGVGERASKLLQRARSDRPYPDDAPETRLRRALHLPIPRGGLTGADVLALGVPPGPLVGAVLAHVAQLRTAGLVASRDDELRAANAFLLRHT
ncbi:CCA tRNA nucleotidyltransferase [Deinococcus yavapaiensis]|uniref:tRNA nucleotidyltransferase (CCA-adding enzyme) n=1 Tax=Deinococcus yavapaiensis KR-236 TaxID=694435 RepID=A0A318S3C7_9DEIO|nr:CCA tRNA nucleotidyltransferase [Deinococcus yavapaiensis]PYE52892.1 tRNA nucleotidyltransferase (CCA-adding enzyme) [Deinococcus yavapaiensis KR-236]